MSQIRALGIIPARGGSKAVWAFIIVFVNLIGPILYFLVGREDGPPEAQAPGPGAMPGWGSPHDPPIVVGPQAGHAGGAAPAVPALAPLEALAPPAPAALPDGPAAIRVEGLAKRYPGGVLALDGLSMVVPTGSVFS